MNVSSLQDFDFNLAESSIHALSNSFTLTRGEKVHSPHTSPKLLKRTSNQEKDAGSSSTKPITSNGKASKPPPIANSSSSGSSSSSSSTSSMTSISRVPLIDISSSETLRMSSHSQDQEAPPIPPRKSTISSDFSRPLKPQPAPPSTPAPEKIESPKVPEHKPKLNFLTHDDTFDDEEDEDPICGPAETITGTLNVFFF